MRRIIYTSRAAPGCDRAELIRLLYHARLSNEARGLSGVLLHSQGRFLQILEGRTWKLLSSFEKIRQDQRHRDVTVVWERSIAAPTFPGWPIRYFDDRNLFKAHAEMTAAAGGTLPAAIEEALQAFAVESLMAAPALSPALPEAVPPSSPRPY
ncbi:BLUF domain-containing protein [Erythrobacter sp. NE805]|uniref:BLUF domain-containing protein n=1 Tax=Erythrobacter sp. NE805 TaxID=3389875 RepID=UPI00396B2D24